MVRRTIAAVGAIILLLLLVVGFRGCLDARKERAIEDYVRDANELIRNSDSDGRQLFEILRGGGEADQPVNRANQVNQLRSSSATTVDRVHDLSPPDELSEAHEYLVEALELRRDGLAVVADALPDALAQEDRRQSTARIAEVMKFFLASDVLLRYRYQPRLRDTLESEDINAPVPSDATLRFVEDIDWVNPDFVADEIAGSRGGGGGGAASPGLHGNGLGTVSLAGVTLTAGGFATVPLPGDAAFDIQVVNQGESTETDVRVTVTVGQGDDAIELEETIPEIAPGEVQTATIPLSEQPPTGQNVPIRVRVEPVPGEEVTDNNEAEFTVVFTR